MEFSKNFYNGELGVKISGGKTEFSVWAPEAEAVVLNLYLKNDSLWPYAEISLKKGEEGVWKHVEAGNLCGRFYTYSYTYSGKVLVGVDPYATASGENAEKGYICDLSLTNPDGWENADYVTLESYTDAVLYEAHVRDFSKDASSGIPEEMRGKFKAFTVEDSKNESSKPTCLAHLKRLGVTHVHLLPIFDYATVDELHPDSSYNWGYDPANYNIVEGSYSSDATKPEARIKELKELVMALHKNGIGVVMDVVYNHTYHTDTSSLNKSYPDYYYRFQNGRLSNGSGCGNEVASDRAMVRKYIVDSVLYWAKEYKIDGFRFDLMAVLDTETLNEIAKKLKEINPSAILYGEGWSADTIALDYTLAGSKQNAEKLPDYAFFNDNYRDAIKGSTFNERECGYISGKHALSGEIAKGLLARWDWCKNPCQIINYCEAHDNHTLWDKLLISAGNFHDYDRKKMSRLAGALVLLAQGVPFIHAGQEFLRSKPLGDGKYDGNSYKSPDSVNSLKWNLLDDNADEVNYFRKLIAFRKKNKLLRLKSAEEIEKHSKVISSPEGTVAIVLYDENEEILIYVNAIPRAKVLPLPPGEWRLYVSDVHASVIPMATFCEGVFAPPISVTVLKKSLKEQY